MSMFLKRDYRTYLTEILSDTSIDDVDTEIAIYLQDSPESDRGYILLEPKTENEENIFFHRSSGNIVYCYGINRINPKAHDRNAVVMFSNSIDYLNYALGLINEQMFIYKIDRQHLVVTGGNFFIGGQNVIISDLDTRFSHKHFLGELLSFDTHLIIGATNYIQIHDGEYVVRDVKSTTDYLVATVIVDAGGIIQEIIPAKTISIGTQGNPGTDGEQGVPGPTGPKGDPGDPAAPTDIAIGTVTKLSPGATPTVTNSGTSLDVILNFGIPQGEKGDKGEKGDPGSITTIIPGVATPVPDNTPAPAGSTTSYSDSEKWVKVRYADGSYRLYTATGNTHPYGVASGIYDFSINNDLTSKILIAGTYNTTTHSISYSDGTISDGTTGNTFTQDGNMAYRNKQNNFSAPQIFEENVTLKKLLLFPYYEKNTANTLKFDGQYGPKHKFTINDSGTHTIHFRNLVAGGSYVMAIYVTGGPATMTFVGTTFKDVGGANDCGSLVQAYEVGKADTDPSDYPLTLAVGPHLFAFEAFTTGVHIAKIGHSKAISLS